MSFTLRISSLKNIELVEAIIIITIIIIGHIICI